MKKDIVYIALFATLANGCANLPPDKELVKILDTVVSKSQIPSDESRVENKENMALLVLGPDKDLTESISIFSKYKSYKLPNARRMGELLLSDGYPQENIIVLTADYKSKIKSLETSDGTSLIFNPQNIFELNISNYNYVIQQLRLNPSKKFFLYVNAHGDKEGCIFYSRCYELFSLFFGGNTSRKKILEDLYSIQSERFFILDTCYSGAAADFLKKDQNLIALFSSDRTQGSNKGKLLEALKITYDQTNRKRPASLVEVMEELDGKCMFFDRQNGSKCLQDARFYRKPGPPQRYRGAR